MKLNSKTATIKIYGIFDPREPEHIRYIGKTKFTLIKRLGQHISSSLEYKRSGLKQDWIKKLINEGIRPDIKLICVTTEEHWEDIERYLIKQYKDDGHELLNIHRGGKLNIKEKPLNEYHKLSPEEMALRVEKRKQTMLNRGGWCSFNKIDLVELTAKIKSDTNLEIVIDYKLINGNEADASLLVADAPSISTSFSSSNTMKEHIISYQPLVYYF